MPFCAKPVVSSMSCVDLFSKPKLTIDLFFPEFMQEASCSESGSSGRNGGEGDSKPAVNSCNCHHIMNSKFGNKTEPLYLS